MGRRKMRRDIYWAGFVESDLFDVVENVRSIAARYLAICIRSLTCLRFVLLHCCISFVSRCFSPKQSPASFTEMLWETLIRSCKAVIQLTRFGCIYYRARRYIRRDGDVWANLVDFQTPVHCARIESYKTRLIVCGLFGQLLQLEWPSLQLLAMHHAATKRLDQHGLLHFWSLFVILQLYSDHLMESVAAGW